MLSRHVSTFRNISTTPTHFQNVGLNAMLAADTVVASSVVAFTKAGWIATLTPEAGLAKVDVFTHCHKVGARFLAQKRVERS